jgi:hypothetical protein
MKKLLAALTCTLLAGCGGGVIPDSSGGSTSVGVTIPQLSTSISILTGDVDVKVSVKNEYALPLKSVRIFLVSYDHDSKLIRGTEATVEVPGPILRGQTLGPVELKSVMQNRDVRCVEVTRIEATRMDYVTLYATGREANALIKGDARRACSTTAGA